ncbi:Colorectal mutant cancer [Schistosoma japonicum]|uniref:Colorectal mutant cancer n=1 Tax=Schistosoma japonicum TaxID=6182 RepID=A0A4Z2D9E7_SCHJA|nr:Colorectal mutant cancer [Schistosoma japonicum]
MQRDFTDLYKVVFPLQELTDTINIQPVDKLGNLSKHKETESHGTKSSIEIESTPYLDNVRHLFECANTLHIQRTAQLRSEIRDLSHRLQGLQTSRDMNYREVQRLQREKEQLRNELTNQVSRYEDRLTELHSVIAELRRRLEHTESNIIHEVEEFEENDIDNDETNDNVSNNYKSDKKLITSKLSLLNTFNNIHSTNQYELNKDISENSDTSVDVILDGDDDDDDDENDNVEDVVASPNDDTRDKYVGIVKQRHQSQLASHNFLMQTNLIYDQLNHNHNLTFLRNHSNNDDNNNNTNTEGLFQSDNHDVCVKYETILSNMQAQLTCLIQERDMLAKQLNELTGTKPTSEIVMEEVLSSSLVVPPTTTTSTTTTTALSEAVGLKSYPVSRPTMGLNRSVQMKVSSNNNNDNNFNLSYPPPPPLLRLKQISLYLNNSHNINNKTMMITVLVIRSIRSPEPLLICFFLRFPQEEEESFYNVDSRKHNLLHISYSTRKATRTDIHSF